MMELFNDKSTILCQELGHHSDSNTRPAVLAGLTDPCPSRLSLSAVMPDPALLGADRTHVVTFDPFSTRCIRGSNQWMATNPSSTLSASQACPLLGSTKLIKNLGTLARKNINIHLSSVGLSYFWIFLVVTLW